MKTLKYCMLPSFVLFFTLQTEAQRRAKVDFYYTVSQQVYKGSFNLNVQFYYNGEYASYFPDIIHYDRFDHSKIQLKVTLSKLTWGRSSHKDRFKLAFGNEINTAGEGLLKTRNSNIYLRSSSIAKNLRYNFADVSVLTPTGIALGFFVLDKDATYADVANSTIADNKVIGFGAYLESFTLVPSNYVESEEGELELSASLIDILFDGFNDAFKEISYNVADAIKTGNEEAFLNSITESRSKTSRSFKERRSTVRPEHAIRDADFRSFQQARSTNSIKAYQNYLQEFPNGRYRQNARSSILALTPFKVDVQSTQGEIYKEYNIVFVEGVGSKQPIMTLTNNDDWGIKEEWKDSKNLLLKLPPERSTSVNFNLGSKDTTMVFSNDHILAEGPAEDQPSVQGADDLESKPDEGPSLRGSNKPILAMVTAIPFLFVIGLLLYRKYQPLS